MLRWFFRDYVHANGNNPILKWYAKELSAQEQANMDMLLNTLESQDIDHKVEAAVNVFLTKQNLNADPADLAQKLSWSIKVRLER